MVTYSFDVHVDEGATGYNEFGPIPNRKGGNLESSNFFKEVMIIAPVFLGSSPNGVIVQEFIRDWANNDDEWDKHKLTSRDTVVSDRCYPDVIFARPLLTKWNGYYHTTAQSELVNRSSKTKDLFMTSVIGWHHK